MRGAFWVGPLRGLGRVHEYYQAARVSRDKVTDFMRTRRMRGRSSKRPSLDLGAGRIELQEVRVEGTGLRRRLGTWRHPSNEGGEAGGKGQNDERGQNHDPGVKIRRLPHQVVRRHLDQG